MFYFVFNNTPTTDNYTCLHTLSLHYDHPICGYSDGLCTGNAAVVEPEWRKPATLFLVAEQNAFAGQVEQQERRPRCQQRWNGAQIAHGEREIVAHEIGKAKAHPKHDANEQLAGPRQEIGRAHV